MSRIFNPENVIEGVMPSALTSHHDDMMRFIGPNADYYIAAFQRMDETGSKMSWNWAAFFGTNAWLQYRKIYGKAWEKHFVSLWMLLPYVCGMYGNWIYKQMVEEELASIIEGNSATQDAELAQRGGVSTGAFSPIVAAIGFGAFIAFMFLLVIGLHYIAELFR